MNEIQKYIAAHEPKMMDDLFSLIRIPSISALPEHHDDMLACAERWAHLLLEAGVDEALVMPSQGNPVVFSQKIVNPDAKTVLIYAHYDVMPAEPLELWKSEPFEPEIRDGHIWARGADDDKGQSFIQVKAFEYLVKNGLLKNNVKFIFEGEEEIGSPSLEAFCEEHKELLKADVILVSDTSMLGAELPSLTTGLRALSFSNRTETIAAAATIRHTARESAAHRRRLRRSEQALSADCRRESAFFAKSVSLKGCTSCGSSDSAFSVFVRVSKIFFMFVPLRS